MAYVAVIRLRNQRRHLDLACVAAHWLGEQQVHRGDTLRPDKQTFVNGRDVVVAATSVTHTAPGELGDQNMLRKCEIDDLVEVVRLRYTQ